MSNHTQEVIDLAALLYTEYCAAVGGKAYNDTDLPTWEEFYNHPDKQKQVHGWVPYSRDIGASRTTSRWKNVVKSNVLHEKL